MKNLKNTIAAIMMIGVMVFGTTFANAGIIIARGADGDTKKSDTTSVCEEPQSTLTGIIIAFTGIIIAGKTGIIIAREKDMTVVNCGIIIA